MNWPPTYCYHVLNNEFKVAGKVFESSGIKGEVGWGAATHTHEHGHTR